ncbi:hypothetical protein QA601_08635 [Chitinispirillales bacterium ANBcel5]|uniref:hypothetical protein n=1 Tax=Cellulosispirillum alkaliphilum TaxID=3039283 RepID=UPI002A52DFE1|nr:hypothetical protein [Chitinispirillales bacterium ANBcel5]
MYKLLAFKLALLFVIFRVEAEFEVVDIFSGEALQSVKGMTINDGQITLLGTSKGDEGPGLNEFLELKEVVLEGNGAPFCKIVLSDKEEESISQLFADIEENHVEGALGIRQLRYWQEDKADMDVVIGNIGYGTHLAGHLFGADKVFKEMLMGEKRFPGRFFNRQSSFFHFTEKILHEEYSRVFADTITHKPFYTPTFKIVPNTVVKRISEDTVIIESVVYKTVFFLEIEDRAIEERYSRELNENINRIIHRVPELKKIDKLFRIYYLLEFADQKGQLRESATISASYTPPLSSVPLGTEGIRKFDMIERHAPKALNPAHFEFIHMVVSGGISFSLDRCEVVISDE